MSRSRSPKSSVRVKTGAQISSCSANSIHSNPRPRISSNLYGCADFPACKEPLASLILCSPWGSIADPSKETSSLSPDDIELFAKKTIETFYFWTGVLMWLIHAGAKKVWLEFFVTIEFGT